MEKKDANAEQKKPRRQERREQRGKAQQRRHMMKKAKRASLYGGIALVVLVIGYFAYTAGINPKVYPPTSIAGHVETFPSQQINEFPIPVAVQKHILEHGGGSNPDKPGILLQYNCRDCPELVETLRAIAKRYPDVVWLAPYPEMTPKIALTTRDKLLAIDAYDEGRILAFIRENR